MGGSLAVRRVPACSALWTGLAAFGLAWQLAEVAWWWAKGPAPAAATWWSLPEGAGVVARTARWIALHLGWMTHGRTRAEAHRGLAHGQGVVLFPLLCGPAAIVLHG